MPGTVLKTGDRAMNSSECVPKQVLGSPQFMCSTFTLQKLSLLFLHYWYLYFLVLAARLCVMQQGRVDFKSYSPKTLASRGERKFINVSGAVVLGPEEPHSLKKHHGVCFLSTKCTGDIRQPSVPQNELSFPESVISKCTFFLRWVMRNGHWKEAWVTYRK